jgi:hypothetical protein
MMTRKDYVAVAKILNDYWNGSPVEVSEFKYMVMDFADMFSDDNPNFNEDKFIEAVFGKVEK